MSAREQGSDLARIRAYHAATRHHFQAYARGPGGLDWETQPDPFRRYHAAPLLQLVHREIAAEREGPRYADALGTARVPPARVDRDSISRLFRDALSLTAWKQAGDARWALRVDPSSGNLHPTEAYLLCGPVEGLCSVPMLAHYAPREHALEVRAEIPGAAWKEGAFFIGLTSIHWREAWKYGERAFRYCQMDAGHAIACVAIAAAGLGWRVELCDDLGHGDLTAILGVADARGVEPEEPECLLAVIPGAASAAPPAPTPLDLRGEPNPLSSDHVDWRAIEVAAEASRKPRTPSTYAGEGTVPPSRAHLRDGDLPLRRIVHQRRSAVAFDGETSISRADFLRSLASTLRGPSRLFPWTPRVHLGLFVHRVVGLETGLYLLARDPQAVPMLKDAFQRAFAWERVDEDLDLYRLARGDARSVARAVSCHQDIASDGAFAVAMLSEFDPALERYGAWFYRRLHWECGAVGQSLYLEAEACGVRATGIGCFFDEPTHEAFGIGSTRLRTLYHFTVGGPVDDPRLQTWPPYPPRDEEPSPGHHDAP